MLLPESWPAGQARGPRLEFHSAFQVHSPQRHITARGQGGDDDVQDSGFPGSRYSADQDVAAQEQDPDGPAVFRDCHDGIHNGLPALQALRNAALESDLR